jgi:hypothetical protein
MISYSDDEKIISNFQKKIDSINSQKQLAFVEKKELTLKGSETFKRPSYHL